MSYQKISNLTLRYLSIMNCTCKKGRESNFSHHLLLEIGKKLLIFLENLHGSTQPVSLLNNFKAKLLVSQITTDFLLLTKYLINCKLILFSFKEKFFYK